MAFVRRARLGDENGIHDSHMRSIREICVLDHGEDEIQGWGYRQNRSRDHWEKTFENEQIFIWVVEHNENIEGHAFFRINREKKTAHLHSLYLTPVVHKQGFGVQMMNCILQTAKEQDIQEIVLESSITAHSFYHKYGFVDTGPRQKSVIGGYPVRNFPMKLICSSEK
jgi:N-acetylglutamate synthase-like GNAT family acetyltransferase